MSASAARRSCPRCQANARCWLALHRLVYLIAPLGVLHFWWMVKKDITEPAIYAAVLAVLLGYRLAGIVAHVYWARRAVVATVNAPRMGSQGA